MARAGWAQPTPAPKESGANFAQGALTSMCRRAHCSLRL
ncbi:hypothetical protein BRCON_2509 [Candidatus Sumerlaea chitinivorans]|uniref:Uncharacterized protein n=1 Tax=Sumerlaea chitinivorans TaxID=2250252 RepID=A0A2Z4Y8C5_SUMC1|nr:hypothetical protein BRCON_2509 [Candidatus Sumerlaea chitinivorans]